MKEKQRKQEKGKGIEELLIEARNRKGWSRIEVVEKLKVDYVTEKEIKKWEIGLKYPDLDMIYCLSELYQIPSAELIQAKNNSYETGLAGVNTNIIKWFCYFLNVSFYTGTVLTILFYVVALVGAFLFFLDMASQVRK